MTSARHLWEEFRRDLFHDPRLGLSVDVSRMNIPAAWLGSMQEAIGRAYQEMEAVERGELVNVDEQRRVGHYWLRDPARAPEQGMTRAIVETLGRIKQFAADVHAGRIQGERGPFGELLVIGIGGSALGPELVSHALGGAADPLRAHFIDNTDPDGMDRVFARLGERLERTLTVVISKSGATVETRNGMLETEAEYRARGLTFGRHAVAVTGEGSALDKLAETGDWLARFPMWDWVGGRTSELSAVGLLPAALQGLDVDGLLGGARECDELGRRKIAHPLGNPSLALALAWYFAGDGQGKKDMVILPYRDRLELLSRYLQQLVMESLGKEHDRAGRVVHQGLAVYGNKGSTDQHAFVQQLRDGLPSFFVTFIEVLRARRGPSIEVAPGRTSGDYLFGFLEGTRQALHEKGRGSITITLGDLDARALGALISLFERAVGFYAAMVNVNAYHQPGVEAGKRAAEVVVALKGRVLEALRAEPGRPLFAEDVAEAVGQPDAVEMIFKILEYLAANPETGVTALRGETLFATRYSVPGS